MKNILLLLIAVFISCYFFSGKASAKLDEMQTVKGEVDSVLIGADPMRGNISEITITSENGQKLSFEVRTGIGITVGTSAKVITLNKLKKGTTVIINYITTKANVKKAMAIELYGYY